MHLRAPGPGPRAPIVLDDPVRHRQHQGDGMIGHRVMIGAERHRHRHAVPRRRREVDLVMADADPRDHLERRRRRQHLLVIGLDPGDRRHDAVQPLDQLGFGEVRARSSLYSTANPASVSGARNCGYRASTGLLHRIVPRCGGATGRSSRTLASAT